MFDTVIPPWGFRSTGRGGGAGAACSGGLLSLQAARSVSVSSDAVRMVMRAAQNSCLRGSVQLRQPMRASKDELPGSFADHGSRVGLTRTIHVFGGPWD